jgi:hypothetical protein
MKKLPFYLITLVFTIFLFSGAYSQGGFSIHGGISVPVGDFGDDDHNNKNANGAATGFNIGGKYQYPLNEGGLGLYLSANFDYNGLKKNIREDIKNGFPDFLAPDAKFTFQKFLNIPVIAGLYYEYKANESVSLFGELGPGIDFLKITDMKLETNGQKGSLFHFKTKPQFAFEAGGGLIIQGKYFLDLHYCGLGKHKGRSEVELNTGTQNIDFDINVSLLTVSLGYRF